jgi:uncharacterized protein YqgV (UPF0045/DUF77 family)
MQHVDQIITCELSFISIGSLEYIEEINQVIDIIKDSGIEYFVSLMSTTLRGKRELVFALTRRIFDEMDEKCKFSIIMKMSNECGCSA